MDALGNENNRIKTALLLAAGTGSRLQPLTENSPKCLTEVNEITILERLISNLHACEFERLVVVVGYLDECVRDFLDNAAGELTLEYIYSEKYRTTNNLYSLWAARHVIKEPFLLLECDLVFDDALLSKMLQPDRIAVSHILPWMNGTTVSLDHLDQVAHFHMNGNQPPVGHIHKTVNMYSFSRASWQRIARRLEQHVSAGRVNGFYETVFAEMVAEGDLSFDAVFFDNRRWYEIDTLEDLRQAELLFSNNNRRPATGVVGA